LDADNPSEDDSESGTDNSASDDSEVQIIEKPATELLPTIDEFESGWRGEVADDGTATYSNVETDEIVEYNITVFESADSAQSALESRQPDNIATSDVDIADGGHMYPVNDQAYRVQFRDQNVICKTFYQGGVLSSESDARSLAQTCADAIVQQQ